MKLPARRFALPMAGLAVFSLLSAVSRPVFSQTEPLTAAFHQALDRCAYAEAESIARRQLEQQRELLGDDHPDVAASMVRLARALLYKPDYDTAESLYRRSLATQAAHLGARHTSTAATMSELGALLAERGQWAEADSLLTTALEIRRELFGNYHAETALSLRDLGRFFYLTGEISAADSVLHEAHAMETDLNGPDSPSALRTAVELGKVLSEYDRTRAEPLLDDTLQRSIARYGTRHLFVAETYTSMGTYYYGPRRMDQAQAAFEKSLAIKREIFPERHPMIADELNNIGVMAMIRGEFAEAEPYLRESLAIFRETKGNSDADVAFLLSQLAVDLSEQGRFEEARPLYDECRSILRAIDPAHPDLLWVLSYEGRDAMNRGEYALAEARYTEAVNARLASGRPDGDAINELRFLARIRVAQDDITGAQAYLERAAAVWEKGRLLSGPDVNRATGGYSPYEPLALTQLRTRQVDAAWPSIERARGRVIADMIIARNGPFLDQGGQPGDSLAYVFSLERVQRSLDGRTAIVGWIDHALPGGKPESWAYVIRDQGPVRWEKLDIAALGSSVSDYVRSIRDRVATAAESPLGVASSTIVDEDIVTLHATHFEPIVTHLDGVEHLIVTPSLVTTAFPFEMLHDDQGRCVGEAFTMSYAPSATIACWLREQPATAVRSGLFVGDPPYNQRHLHAMASGEDAETDEPPEVAVLRSAQAGDPAALASLPRLRWSRQEIETAAAFVEESETLEGTDASVMRVREKVEEGSYDLIHLATHALVDATEWKRCALVLSQVSDADDSNGLITGEVVAEDWSLNAELVVLSACETGLGQDVLAEGTVGFSYPFLVAGARSLLVSLWKVDDRATSLFMQHFYEGWLGGDGETKAAALRDAKLWLRNFEDENGAHPYEHPYYWSAFVLVGDGR